MHRRIRDGAAMTYQSPTPRNRSKHASRRAPTHTPPPSYPDIRRLLFQKEASRGTSWLTKIFEKKKLFLKRGEGERVAIDGTLVPRCVSHGVTHLEHGLQAIRHTRHGERVLFSCAWCSFFFCGDGVKCASCKMRKLWLERGFFLPSLLAPLFSPASRSASPRDFVDI